MKRTPYEVHRSLISVEGVNSLVTSIKNQRSLFRFIPEHRYGMNMPYSILDGTALCREIPEATKIAERLHQIVQKFAGEEVKLMNCEKRRIRLHLYDSTNEGILWHIDGATFTALITLENETEGGIEIFSLSKSRFLSLLVYPLYFWQGFFSLFKPEPVIVKPGDMVLIYGGKAVHRTIYSKPGSRLVLAVSFDPVAKKGWSLRDFLLERLNVTVKQVTQK